MLKQCHAVQKLPIGLCRIRFVCDCDCVCVCVRDDNAYFQKGGCIERSARVSECIIGLMSLRMH